MKRIIIPAFAAICLAACINENECSYPESDCIGIAPEIANLTTRTSYTGSTAAWANGDVLGLYCAQSTPAASNLAYTYASAGPTWTPASAIYWKDGTTAHRFYAYAPWATGTPTATAIPLPALTPQNGTISASQDFLYSNNKGSGVTRASNNPLALVFVHAFSLIELDVKLDASFAAGTTLTSFTVGSATTADKIYTADGNSTYDITTGTATYAASGTLNTLTAASGTSISTTAKPFYLLVLPGSFGTMTLSLVINENSVSITLPAVNLGVNTFAPATKYAFQVNISRTAITLSTPTITDWTAGTGGTVNVGL